MSIQTFLQKQRSKSHIPVEKLTQFLYTPQIYEQLKEFYQKGPKVQHDFNLFNKSRLNLIIESYKYLSKLYNFNADHPEYDSFNPHIKSIYSYLLNPQQNHGDVHTGMFCKYIELMGTQEHKKQYLDKCRTFQIVGCYAQTEIAHGSDIRSLQTTAIFDQKTQQWIINTPSLNAAKYWPGQLSFISNYAIVFAQAIVKGKSKGVFPFLMQIKDSNYNWLPGIEGGDIGPKIGFHAKQNGYMMIHNIRIPKNNLLNKYVKVSDNGEISTVGDPRVGYGTMMLIRQMISFASPKIYAVPIIIGAKYSFFRQQFRNAHKVENSIIDYQTQQQKIIPRIAEGYALGIGGTRIQAESQQNIKNVLKNDFSLLQETHSNLSFGKALYSEIAAQGIQIIRRSLGGHGTSYYSGVPQIFNEYLADNTLEGENTILYIQTAKYILKSYVNFITKGKTLSDSVRYIQELPKISEVKFINKKEWEAAELRNLLLKGIHHTLGLITARLADKRDGETEADIFNYKIGGRLQQLAQLHGVHFTVETFLERINKNTIIQIKPILLDLCKLFTIDQINRLAETIIEGGLVCSVSFASLAVEKQKILHRLRPQIAVLIESFAIPKQFVRSQIAYGHPYNNLLDRARKCELNQQIQESARIISQISLALQKTVKPKL